MAAVSMRRAWRNLAIAASTLVVLGGCGIAGQWELTTVDPNAARRDVDYQTMELKKDGSFYAESKEQGAIKTTSGTYTYKDDVLSLKPHDRETRTFDAKLMDSGNKLHLEQFWENQKVKMDYQRRD